MANIETLKKQLEQVRQDRTSLANSIPELQQQIENLKAEMQTAAASGEITTYKQLYRTAEDLRLELEATEQYLASLPDPALKVSDVRPTWESVVSDFNTAQARDIKKYEELRKQLFALFCNILRRQNQFNRDRLELALLVEPDKDWEMRRNDYMPGWMARNALETLDYKDEFAEELEKMGITTGAADYILTGLHFNENLNI